MVQSQVGDSAGHGNSLLLTPMSTTTKPASSEDILGQKVRVYFGIKRHLILIICASMTGAVCPGSSPILFAETNGNSSGGFPGQGVRFGSIYAPIQSD